MSVHPKDRLLQQQVMQTIGAASMLWGGEARGTFDAGRAVKLGEELIEFVRKTYIEQPPQQGNDER
jgi:hypothetical protein